MLIASISDTHLGYRAYSARTKGRNSREVDVEGAWHEAVRGICAAEPDLVTLAGDIFDKPRVSNQAIGAYVEGITRILDDTRASIVVVAGNHEVAKTAAVMTPLQVLPETRRLRICLEPETFLMAPSTAQITVLPCSFEPKKFFFPDYDSIITNVLVMHGAVASSQLPPFYGEGGLPIEMLEKHFDVIALGDYHQPVVFRTDDDLDCLAYYSGALERVTTKTWTEEGPFGWVLADTDKMEVRHMPVHTRAVRDIHIDVTSAEDLNASLARIEVQEGEMLRVVAAGLSRAERQGVDQKLVRAMKQEALHFRLDLRWTETQTLQLGDRRKERQTLEELARAFFAKDIPEVRNKALAHINPDWAEWEATEE